MNLVHCRNCNADTPSNRLDWTPYDFSCPVCHTRVPPEDLPSNRSNNRPPETTDQTPGLVSPTYFMQDRLGDIQVLHHGDVLKTPHGLCFVSQEGRLYFLDGPNAGMEYTSNADRACPSCGLSPLCDCRQPR